MKPMWVVAGAMLLIATGAAAIEAEHMVVGFEGSPYIRIYERSGAAFTALSAPADIPDGPGKSVAWHPGGAWFVVGTNGGNNITVYGWDGSTATRLAYPDTNPVGITRGLAFNPAGTMLAAFHTTTPFVTIYEVEGTTLTKLANPGTLPTGEAWAGGWSPTGNLLAVAHSTSPFVTIYSVSGTTFTKVSDPSSLPGGNGRGAAFSPNGQFLAVCVISATDPIRIYQVSGTTFTAVADPSPKPPNSARECSWRHDSNYLMVPHSNAPGATMYERSGTTFTKAPLPAVRLATVDNTCGGDSSWSTQGNFVGATCFESPYLRVWEFSGLTLQALTLNTPPTTQTSALAIRPGTETLPSPAAGSENFETQRSGLYPLATWYTAGVYAAECGTGDTPAGTFRVQAGGPPGSTLMYNHERPSGVNLRTCFYFSTLDVCRVGELAFHFQYTGTVQAGKALAWLFGSGNGVSADPSIGFNIEEGGEVVFLVRPDGTGGPNEHRAAVTTIAADTWAKATFNIDCANNVFSLTVDGETATASVVFPDIELRTLRLSMGGVTTGTNAQRIDNLGLVLLPESIVPSEFDQGLRGLFVNMGFQSLESQYLLSLFFIGIGIVVTAALTKIMASGRGKNITIAGVSASTAIFCMALFGLPFWGVTMAIILGAAFVVQSPASMANTYMERLRQIRAPEPTASTGIVDSDGKPAPEGITTERTIDDENRGLDELRRLRGEGPEEPVTDGAVTVTEEAVTDGAVTVTEEASKTVLSKLRPNQRATIQLDKGAED